MFNLKLIEKIKINFEASSVIDDKEVTLSTDSRKYKKGQMFIALRGENFDGFSYAENILKESCPIIVFTNNAANFKKAEELKNSYPETNFISTSCTLTFLQELASLRIREWQSLKKTNRTVGITGSNGKTTNKEMLFHLLNTIKPGLVHCTKGNFNNHIGVPLTILEIEDHIEISIIEMGTNHMGEISVLCDIANPDSGLITNIGDAHLEFFKERKNIFTEKSSLFNYVSKNLREDSVFIINKDDDFLKDLDGNFVTSFGNSNATYNYDYANSKITFEDSKESISLKNERMKEKFNFINLMSTYLLSYKLFPNAKENLIVAAEQFTLPKNNRSQWIDLKNKSIYLDAYNANPSSMRSSIESYIQTLNEKKVDLERVQFVLGDMNELGDLTEKMHRDIAELLNDYDVSHAIFVGKYSHNYAATFKGNCKVFSTKLDMEKSWETIFEASDYFFIKASRSLQLESLIDIT